MNVEASQVADLHDRVAIHAAMADAHRLRIADLLAVSDRAPSELAERLAIGSNLLAHHVAILERAGLVERLRSDGDGRRRYLRLTARGREASLSAGEGVSASEVLFVCTGNSARSQIAAALWNRTSPVPAGSAGTHPDARVHLGAVRAARRAGFDLSAARPRSIDAVREQPDLVVTVCDRAHEELGSFGSDATVLHWSIPDPAATTRASAFDEALARLDERVSILASRVVSHAPRKPGPTSGRSKHRRSPAPRGSEEQEG